MKIIYSGLKYDYCDPKRGLSFEHVNFYETLARMEGVDVIYFPYERLLEVGRDAMNQELLDLVKKEKPDIFFAVMFTDELNKDVLDEIKKCTTSLAWFCDDHWRFDNYSRFYAPHFTWVATTYSKAPEKYKKIGYNNAIHSQWACNDFIYKPIHNIDAPIDYKYEVSFVGQKNSAREKIINKIKDAGINIQAFGNGWDNGRVTQQQMIDIFCRSKINLNLNPPQSGYDLKSFGRLFFRRSSNKYVLDFWNFFGNIGEWFGKRVPMIKARPFEISGCGGFVISGLGDGIEYYYQENKEMVFYKNTDDLIEKIKFYSTSREIDAIRKAGYERTIKEHTYKQRFNDIFNKITKSNI